MNKKNTVFAVGAGANVGLPTISKILLLVTFMLSTGCQPSTETIGRQVQGQLQQKIDAAFSPKAGEIYVKGVVAVPDAGHRYQGIADVVAFSGHISLKVSILADRDHLIYEVTTADWDHFITLVYEQKLMILTDEYSNAAAENARVLSCFPPTLQRDKQAFVERLAVVARVKREGIYWVGSGCKAHQCSTDAAVWAIDQSNGHGYAILKSTDIAGWMHFAVYGSEVEDAPPPLVVWGIDQGMTPSNSVHIVDSAARHP